MFKLIDTFNKRLISRHRTVAAAVKAGRSYQRAVKRANGPYSYIPTAILRADGLPVNEYEIDAAYLALLR